MDSKWTKRTIHEIGLDHMLSDRIVYEIVMSQFEATRDNIRDANPEEDNAPIIRLTELITFKVKPRKLKYLTRAGRERYKEIQRKKALKLKG